MGFSYWEKEEKQQSESKNGNKIRECQIQFGGEVRIFEKRRLNKLWINFRTFIFLPSMQRKRDSISSTSKKF